MLKGHSPLYKKFCSGFTLMEFSLAASIMAYAAFMTAQQMTLKRANNNIKRAVWAAKISSEGLERYYINNGSLSGLSELSTLCDGSPRYLPPHICYRSCSLNSEGLHYSLSETTNDTTVFSIPVDSEGIANRVRTEILRNESAAVADVQVDSGETHTVKVLVDLSFIVIEETNTPDPVDTEEEDVSNGGSTSVTKKQTKKEKKKEARVKLKAKKQRKQKRKAEQKKIQDLTAERNSLLHEFDETHDEECQCKISKIERKITLEKKAAEARTPEEQRKKSSKSKAGWNNKQTKSKRR